MLKTFISYIEGNVLDHSKVPITEKSIVYHCITVPKISIGQYISHFFEEMVPINDHPGILLHTLIIFNRIKKTVIVSSKTVHRIFLASLIISVKMYYDEPVDNITWAKMCRQSLKSINYLESQTAITLDFNFFIDKLQVDNAAKSLVYCN